MKNLIIIFIIIFLSLASILIGGDTNPCKAKSNSTISSYENNSKENLVLNENNYSENRRYRILVATLRRNLLEKYNELDEMWFETDYLELAEPHVDEE